MTELSGLFTGWCLDHFKEMTQSEGAAYCCYPFKKSTVYIFLCLQPNSCHRLLLQMSSRELPFQTIRVWLVAAVGRENVISRTMPGSAIQWSRIEFSPPISSPCSTIQCCTVSPGTDIYHHTAKCPFQQRPQKLDARFTCNNLNQALPVASLQSCTFLSSRFSFLAELPQLYLMASWSHYKVSLLIWGVGSKLAPSKGGFVGKGHSVAASRWRSGSLLPCITRLLQHLQTFSH